MRLKKKSKANSVDSEEISHVSHLHCLTRYCVQVCSVESNKILLPPSRSIIPFLGRKAITVHIQKQRRTR